MVWYSHLLKNFPQFIMIHTVKGFLVVNEAEVMPSQAPLDSSAQPCGGVTGLGRMSITHVLAGERKDHYMSEKNELSPLSKYHSPVFFQTQTPATKTSLGKEIKFRGFPYWPEFLI